MDVSKKTAPRGGFFSKVKIALFLLVGTTYAIYWNGLFGPFILDDANLSAISDIGGVNDLRSLWRYLASDLSGYLGRPISNLTFLANYSAWPTSPFPFKATNLAIHLILGGLVFQFTRILLDKKLPLPQGAYVALIVSSYWLLNPLNVSTVLYSVQRMTMLYTLFIILGIIAYIHGRKLQAKGHNKGYVWMSSGLILGTLLAVLSKENGALLPVYILLIEYSVIRHFLTLPAPHRLWTLLFLWLPAVALLIVVGYFSTTPFYEGRSFTLVERLLTECRVLVEYIYYWFNPFAISRGVLASDYPISTNLISPWHTILAALVIIGSITWALVNRKRHPLSALAVLFYFSGHIMESTTLPLEIYFEHRNYLPAILLILPVAIWITNKHFSLSKITVPILVAVIFSAQAVQTYRLTKIWGNELELASWWSHYNPGSTRAQDYFATVLTSANRPDLALKVLDNAIRNRPEDSHYYLHALYTMCKYKQVEPTQLVLIEKQLSLFPVNKKSYPLLKEIAVTSASGICKGLSSSKVVSLISTVADHPTSKLDPGGYGRLMHIKGLAQILDQQPDMAIQSFSLSLKSRPVINTGLEQVALLGTYHHYRQALEWLIYIESMPRKTSIRDTGKNWDIQKEIDHLRSQLKKMLDKP